MIKCKEINSGLKKSDGSSRVYDIIWGNKSSEGLNKNRRGELLKVLAPANVSHRFKAANSTWTGDRPKELLEKWSKDFSLENKTVVDFGAGRGAYSTAAAELGAKSVFMLDGSLSAIQTYEKRLQNTENLILPAEEIAKVVTKCHIDLNRPEEFLEKNGKHFADVIFSRYVLMHTQNPFIALYNMTRFLKPGGLICFNTYLPPSVSQLTRAERSAMLTVPWGTKIALLSALGKIKKADKQFTVQEFISGAGPNEFDYIRNFYIQRIVPNFSMDEIEKTCFHVEDSTTPYLHTPTEEQIHFVSNLLALKPDGTPAEFGDGGGLRLEDGDGSITELWCGYRTTKETLEVEIDQIPRLELIHS